MHTENDQFIFFSTTIITKNKKFKLHDRFERNANYFIEDYGSRTTTTNQGDENIHHDAQKS